MVVEAGSSKGRVQMYVCDEGTEGTEGTEDTEGTEGTEGTRQPGAWSTRKAEANRRRRKGDSRRLTLVELVRSVYKGFLAIPVPTIYLIYIQVNH